MKRARTHAVCIFSGLLVLTSLLGAAACGSKPAPTATPTASATPAMPTATETPTSTATPIPTATITPTASPTRNPNLNPLTGLPVADAALLARPPILARVGNDPQIRPQAGLGEADIVYEDIMDGWWVTRLTAIFLGNDPETIGPIRSARLVTIELANQYQGALVHSGASDPVRWLMSQEDFINLDEFFHPRPFYYVDGLGWMGRLHTSAPAVREYLEGLGLDGPVKLRGFEFSDKAPTGPKAAEVYIPYPETSAVDFRYDADSGTYLRWVRGVPHTDRLTGEQLAVSNVIVQFVEHQPTDMVEDTNGATSIRIIMTGRGPAWLFRDGVVVKGYWERNETHEMTRFVDAQGHDLALKPGHTWVELVPPEYEIEYGPTPR